MSNSDIHATENPSADAAVHDTAVHDMLRAFRRRHIEPAWEHLDRIDNTHFAALWTALQETGFTAAALPEAESGIALDATALFAAFFELGAASPALAAALLAHLAAQALLVEAGGGHWPAALLPADAHCALLASPLDAQPESGFRLSVTGGRGRISGSQRVMLPAAGWLLLPVQAGNHHKLCVLRADAEGFAFALTPSSHGLCLLPFGKLIANNVAVAGTAIFDWPAAGRAAHLADGLLTALLAGINDELALRAMDYARQRYQAGKMISEHHAVQQLVGPMEVARQPLRALAMATLAGSLASGSNGARSDGSASAFAVQIARRSALDAIQTFGGYGYMQDYRVERYLRDANTLETFWIRAAQRERDAATRRCAALTRGEAA